MAEFKKNSSYENTMAQLHARYNGIGTSSEPEKREMRELGSPSAFSTERRNRAAVSDKYLSGELDGKKYMTTDDFIKYYNANKKSGSVVMPRHPSDKTKEIKKPVAVSAKKAQENVKTYDGTAQAARAKRYADDAPTIEMPALKERKSRRTRLSKLFEKWFPSETKSAESTEKKRRFPVAVVGLIVTASISMLMIVGSTVLVADAQSEISDVKRDIRILTKEASSLEEELNKKDDLEMISEYATSKLGMIRQDSVASVYMKTDADDCASGQEEQSSMGTILSAMFGN